MSDNITLAFILTLGAGLATGIGSAIAFFAHHTDRKFLSFSLGLSAGVMLYVSFAELLSDSRTELIELFGEKSGQIWCAVSFFAGILLAALIDYLVPEKENPHELKSVEMMDGAMPSPQKMAKAGIITAIAIGVHNFPEGVATFMATISDTTVGIPIAIAVAIHNIPEGIAVAAHLYYKCAGAQLLVVALGAYCQRTHEGRAGSIGRALQQLTELTEDKLYMR